MTTKTKIVEEIANCRMVERMVTNITHHPLNAQLKDLCQMVYEIILDYDDDKIIDLYEHGELRFFVARVIINQYYSSNSRYHKLYRKFQARTTELGDIDLPDGEE